MNKFTPETLAGLDAIIQAADGVSANRFWMETGVKPCELIVKLANEVKLLRKEQEE